VAGTLPVSPPAIYQTVPQTATTGGEELAENRRAKTTAASGRNFVMQGENRASCGGSLRTGPGASPSRPPVAVLQASLPTAFQCFEFGDGNLGLAYRGGWSKEHGDRAGAGKGRFSDVARVVAEIENGGSAHLLHFVGG
jgi:hypothetical protein